MSIPIKIRDNNDNIRVKVRDNTSNVQAKGKTNTEQQSLHIKDNSKDVKIKVNDNVDEVLVNYGCDVKEKVLDNKITKEREERIAADTQEKDERIAADEELEKQIQEIIVGGVRVDETTITFNDNNELSVTPELQETIRNKQDKIEFVEINPETITGQLSSTKLNLLTTNMVNRILRGDKIYYLSIKEDNTRKYFSTSAEDYDEIDIDITTGKYQVKNTRIIDHINNTTIHITQDEREFWNKKLNCLEQVESNETLILNRD